MASKLILLLFAVCGLLGGCGSMNFGETALETMSVIGEAYSIKQCYESGGTYATCEGYRN